MSISLVKELNQMNDEAALDIRETAKLLNVTVAAVRRWVREKRGPAFFKAGRLVRFRRREIEWVLNRVQEPRYHRIKRRWSAPCPAHPKKGRSLSILTYECGVVLVCSKGCTSEKICRALRITPAELLKVEHRGK